MSTRGVKFNFEPGEFVLCFEPDPTKARVIYEAKILDTTVYRDEEGKRKPGYHIHFLRWNNSWDRIVGEQLVLKTTDENRLLMKQLAEVTKKSIKNKTRRRRIHDILSSAFSGKTPFEHELQKEDEQTTDSNDTDESTEETDSSESDTKMEESKRSLRGVPSSDIEIPEALKAVLDKDYFAVNQDGKYVRLPAEVNVVTVLESFVKTFMMDFWSPDYDRTHLCHQPPKIAIERILPICKEFVDGVRICFDFTLATLLLYSPEREQHTHLMSAYTSKSPARQKVQSDDSPLLKSPRSHTSSIPTPGDESCPKLPKYSPSVEEDDEVTFNPTSMTPRRILRSRGSESGKKLDFEKHAEVKEEKKEPVEQLPRKRRCSDRQDEPLKRRALRSCRKCSEDSNDSEESKPETIMSEPAKSTSQQKTEKEEPSPPLLIPCNMLGTRPQGGVERVGEKGAPGSVDSVGDSGREILATILQWQLLPPEALNQLPTPPALLYGPVHLLRLFVKLPDLLAKMNIEENKLGVLKKLSHQFLLYVADHIMELFPETTYTSSYDY
ncbi:male-specific lethal 3 homolog [Mya arenaria]|uniref:male-specific lethal 3 homolog n=1 Tax=Mya arenaria TaxID=6604 RepID=UPI0022E8F225|nr:male-specific lethal 3 homolog [Mya arenaria]